MATTGDEPLGLEQAMIGDIHPVPESHEVPTGWIVMDGTTFQSWEFPEFVTAMAITGATFTLPKPRQPESRKFIIKMGRRIAPISAPPDPLQFRAARRAELDALRRARDAQ